MRIGARKHAARRRPEVAAAQRAGAEAVNFIVHKCSGHHRLVEVTFHALCSSSHPVTQITL